ncbi:MAG TPA: ABC transporter permease [Candidatus Dormibacteraeota bacterium]|nr:ABC transporter permease [Candidatus Dormibacteraeota bacterium]
MPEMAAQEARTLPVVGLLPRRRRLSVSALAGLSILAALIVLWAWGTLAPPHDPLATDPASQLLPPGPGHLMGTDTYGRDVLSRVMAGAGLDLTIAASVTGASFVVGILVGALAGYHGGWIDDVVLRVVDVILSFPAFVLALAITVVLGNSVRNVVIAIAVAYTPYFVRLTRGEILSARRADYADNARAIGNPSWRVVFLHLLPNCIMPALVQASLTMGWSILDASGLSFLGLGIKPPTPEWGVEVGEGASNIVSGEWWTSVFPGLAITLAVLSFNLLGEAIQARFRPRR